MSVAMATVRYAGWHGSLSEESPRRRRVAALAGLIAGTASRHLPSSTEESAAGTSFSLPPKWRFNIGARVTAQDGGQRYGIGSV